MEEFVVFLLAFEAGLTRRVCSFDSNLLRFHEARKSGWSDDPRDAGGATMCGVTLATYKAWCKSHGLPVPTKNTLRNIPYAHWRGVVKQFWDVPKADSIDCPALAWLIVDWVWGSGPAVLKNVQRVVNSLPTTSVALKVDGVFGAKTLATINGADPGLLFERLKAERVRYIEDIVRRRPSQRVFLKGWMRRLDAITFNGLVC